MKFHTEISETQDDVHKIRGQDMEGLIESKSFVDVIFLLLRGSFPNEKEKQLLEAVLVASVENGIQPPSSFVSRVSLASGNEFHVALSAGLLAMGEKHGGAGEGCAKILSSGKTAEQIVSEHKIIPGFGHKIYKQGDLRAQALKKKSESLGFSGKYFQLAEEIEKELKEKRGKELHLNIDGALACCMLELGFDPRLGKALFIISRIVGMSAHVLEELNQGNSYYRLDESDIV